MRAQRQGEFDNLIAKARQGEALTVREWEQVIQPNGMQNKSVEWLIGIVGRPDERIGSEPFLVFKDRVIEPYTGKMIPLVVKASFGLVDDELYDYDALRNR